MGLLLLNHGAGGSPSHRRNGRTLPWLMTFPIHCCLSSTYPFKQLSVFVSHMFTHPLFALHLIKKWWIQSFQSWGPFRSTKICWMSKIKGLKTLLVPFSTQKGLIGLGSAQSPHKVLLVLGMNQYQCCLSFLLSITRYCFQSPLKNIYLSKWLFMFRIENWNFHDFSTT